MFWLCAPASKIDMHSSAATTVSPIICLAVSKSVCKCAYACLVIPLFSFSPFAHCHAEISFNCPTTFCCCIKFCKACTHCAMLCLAGNEVTKAKCCAQSFCLTFSATIYSADGLPFSCIAPRVKGCKNSPCCTPYARQ